MNKKTIILWILSGLLFAVSFLSFNSDTTSQEVRDIQKKVVHRQKILDEYAQKALKVGVDEWLHFDAFPEDMVIYKYNADTLQSWINLFPIGNDEVDIVPLWYRIHDMNNRNLFNAPLAFISGNDQYVNLGSSWYVVKTYNKGSVKIITGLLVKNEYVSENAVLTNQVNSRFGLDKHFTVVPINLDDSNVVFGKDGAPLFSVVSNVPLTYVNSSSTLKWVTLLFVLLAIFSYHNSKRSVKSFFITFVGLGCVRVATIILARNLELDSRFFSPTLYADGTFFNSLANLLINHLFVFLLILAIFMIRKIIFRNILSSKLWGKRIKSAFLLFIPVLLIAYIHLSLRSIILNSNIVLELYRIEEISLYTILIYSAYAFLFLALIYSIQMVMAIFKNRIKVNVFSARGVIVLTLICSLYATITVSFYGFKREFERNRVWTNKLAIERDLSLEIKLRSIENHIVNDPLIRFLISAPQGNELIRNRLLELYFWNISQEYDLRITICADKDPLITENYSYPVDCFAFFQNDIIDKYGVQLAPNSYFYYVDNYKSRVSYIGVFSFIRNAKLHNMYIEIDSKLMREAIGYPSLLIDTKKIDESNMPSYYSYAKYFDKRLTSFKGRYNYPIIFELDTKEGYSFQTINGYTHFVNKVSEDYIVVVSRKVRSILPYIVSFSYLFLFLCAVNFSVSRFRQRYSRRLIDLPKNSFRRKITFLLTASMVIALIFMGIGSVVYTISIIDENNRMQMEEKLFTVQTTISEICKYAQRYNEINTLEMFNAMDKVANNTQVDINLYDPTGRLIRSTKPEVFDQYLMSSRMNPDAFYQLIHSHRRQVIHKESIANLSYYSLYAPIFNASGTLLAIANIPYFLNDSEFREDASSIIATIINLYLLLLLAAILAGTTISNSLTKPLAEISKKMKGIDFSQKAEHINYKNKDELGILVSAYNKMLDDLDESSKQLAQNEREQAWREMARQIAHEIKNPLTPMRLSIQHLVRLRKQNIPGWQEKFDAISTSLLEQIDILSETATEFSSFAKFYNEESTIIDLVSLINEQYILFDTRDNVSFTFLSDVPTAYVFARKSQLTRAFVNLISNAIQAIEHSAEGKVIVSISEDGQYYKIEVEDNGTGVSPENQNKLFKPNFTTKSGGTGLGLAICKNIFDQSQGNISYEQSPMGGANFVVRLLKYREG